MEKKLSYNCERVLSVISRDKNHPTHVREIKLLTGLSRRRITDAVRELRKTHPVCSTNYEPGGYWLGGKEDVQELILRLKRTAATTLETADNLKKLYNKME